MNDIIALIGNPNSGKTTLFNALTGTYQKTGNWTGVTTEKKEGEYKKNRSIKIIDLPGIYALTEGSADENALLEYLKTSPPKAIINIVDGTNLERNLYLTFQLKKLNIPMVVAVNMYDDLEKNHIKLDVKELERLVNAPVTPISALKGKNLPELMTEAIKVDLTVTGQNLDDKQIYSFIEESIGKIIQKKQTKAEIFTQKADDILTHRFWGIPIFLAVITLVYFLSINFGGFLGGFISTFFDAFTEQTFSSLNKIGAPEWLNSLVCKGVFNGVGTVLAFLPQVLVLFILMSLIEQSGYASRIAFNLDKLFRFFGLGGKSLIPMILSCGCTVTGLTATRTIESEREKKMTVFLCPFMPCSAKMAVFGWFACEFFNGRAIVATAMYFLSIIIVIVLGLILKRFNSFKEKNGDFVLEMPTLRAPSFKDVISVMWEKTKDFTAKAGSVIFIVSVVLWTLLNVGVSGYTYGIIEDSFLYYIGNLLKYIFYPLGFASWQASVAVITGAFAKEAVVETLSILGCEAQTIFSNCWSVLAFMSFVLLSPPCVASISMAKRELKSNKLLALMLLVQFITAYIVAFIINGIGYLLSTSLLLSAIIVIIIAWLFALSIMSIRRIKCGSCKACRKGENKCQKNTKRNTI